VKRSFLIAVAALTALVAGTVALLLPPRALPPTPSTFAVTWPVARGAYHVHSRRSDGTGTLDEIAAAAARAGLQFVVVTDHGDGTRMPEAPQYRSGVLCIDGVEVSAENGHYVALDLPVTPYPLAGHSRDVIEDVRRFGGFGFAAHPGSPKAALRWEERSAAFDGLEWLNADSEWRDEFWGSLGGVLLTYAFRPVETLGGLLDRPDEVIALWDELTTSRRVPAIAGADAHARLGYRQAADPYEDRVLARLPGYEVSFRAFVNHVLLDQPLSGDAAGDASLVLSALREGRIFTSIDSFAGLSAFEARAVNGRAVARPGEYIDITAPVAIEVAIAAPADTSLAVFRNGELLYESREAALRIDVGREPGVYRIEARLPSQTPSSPPWVLSNPFYVGLRENHARAAIGPAPAPASTRTPVATDNWTGEASPGSSSRLQPVTLGDGTPAVEWQFSLAGGRPGGQFAALRFPLSGGLGAHDRLQVRVQSDQPRRLWAQLRASDSQRGERWGRSFPVGPDLESLELRFTDFRPLEAGSAARPPLDRVDSLLLVIDTVNTRPGSTGRLAFTDLWLAR
jgi:hypothetical protein